MKIENRQITINEIWKIILGLEFFKKISFIKLIVNI